MIRNGKNIILVITILLITAPLASAAGRKNNVKMNSAQGMANYLRSRRLPALESVEVWDNVYAPGLKITTKHYEVYTTLLDPLMLSRVPGFVESAYNAYQKQLAESIETTVKMPMYLFAKRGQWEEFTKTFTGKNAPLYLKIKEGAYCLNDACVGYNIGIDDTFSVLAHEGWHQFNQRLFKYRLPSWLDEGIAMSFENSVYKDGLFTFDPSRNMGRLGGLRLTLEENKFMPISQLISLNPGQTVVKSDQATQAFYSQSYALVRFLKEDEYGIRLAQYHRMLKGGINGTWPLPDWAKKISTDRNIPLTAGYNSAVGKGLFEFYIGKDYEQLQQSYEIFCKKLVYNIRVKRK